MRFVKRFWTDSTFLIFVIVEGDQVFYVSHEPLALMTVYL